MGLFINDDRNQGIYKNQEEIKGANQDFFKSDHLTELLKKQQKINDLLYRSVLDQMEISRQQNYEHRKSMDQRLDELKKCQDRKNDSMAQKLRDLKAGNRRLRQQFISKQLSEQEWIEQIHSVQQSNDEIKEQLREYAVTGEQLEEKVDQQIHAQSIMSGQIIEQTEKHTDFIDRLDSLEGVSENTLKQLDQFLSIEMARQLNCLKEVNEKYDRTEQEFLNWIAETRKIQQKFADQVASEKELADQVDSIAKTIDEITEQLKPYKLENVQLIKQLDEQMKLLKQKDAHIMRFLENSSENKSGKFKRQYIDQKPDLSKYKLQKDKVNCKPISIKRVPGMKKQGKRSIQRKCLAKQFNNYPKIDEF